MTKKGIGTTELTELLRSFITVKMLPFFYVFSDTTSNKFLKCYKEQTLKEVVKVKVLKERYKQHCYWILPLLVGLNSQDPYDVDYNDEMGVKHWILCIVDHKKSLVTVMDSFNSIDRMRFWGALIHKWLKETIEIHTTFLSLKMFSGQSDKRHQTMSSVNCGYYCCMYFLLHLQNYNVEEIEAYKECNDTDIEKFKTMLFNNEVTRKILHIK